MVKTMEVDGSLMNELANNAVGEVGTVSTAQLSWAHRVPAADLSPHDIHLWAINLNEASLEEAWLTDAELARAAQYKNPLQRARYHGGRIGMRILLCAYTNIANDELRFGYGEKGKPVLLNELRGGDFCFNYTLSGNNALYAFAWNRQVGIDLETFPRKVNSAGLAKRKLTTTERLAWNEIPPQQQDQAMLACWTRKEAYGKALGVGIRYQMNQAPIFINLNAPAWQSQVTGLFDETPATPPNANTPKHHDEQILHGMQIAPPFPGIAALVYDGAEIGLPTNDTNNADSASNGVLQAWQWKPTTH